MQQLDKERRQYDGAETISGIGETTRPGEAAVLVEDEERLRRIIQRFEEREKNSTTQPANSYEARKIGVSRNAIRPETFGGTHTVEEPPPAGEKILLLFLPKYLRECLIGDLREEYQKIRPIHGTIFANRWYWKQVVSSILWLMPRAVGKSILIDLIGEWIRRNSI